MPNDGEITTVTTTGATQADAQASNADATGTKYTDEDLARARKSFEKNAQRQIQKAVDTAKTEASTQILEQLGLTDIDELEEFASKLQQTTGAAEQATTLQRQLKKLTADLEKREASENKLRTIIRNGAIKTELLATAQKLNGHPESVYAHALVNNRVQADDDGQVFILDENGDPDATLTLEKYVQGLLAEHKHLQRPGPQSGGGSLPAATERQSSLSQLRTSGGLSARLKQYEQENPGSVRTIIGRG